MTIREAIEKQNWKFAKSYAFFAPHEYIVRGKCNLTDEEFDKFGDFILKNGMRMFYYKTERKYLYHDGYFYWIMRSEENPANAVINRCKPDDYDVVFVRKNTWLNSKKAQEEYVQLELDLGQMEG